MRCPSCRHELTEAEVADKALRRLGKAYCAACIGQFKRGGAWPFSERSIEQIWDHGGYPPGVVTWAARQSR